MNWKKFFSVEIELIGLKKYKVYKFLFFKYYKRKKNYSIIKKFFKSVSPQPIEDIRIINQNHNQEDVVSICAIYKNEPDIVEWIEYHRLIGVDRFYLYDNGSTDNSFEKIKPYIDSGIVVYHYVTGREKQLYVYRDAVYRYKNNTKWLAIIDLDEYICPVAKDNLKDILADYENYAALGINWVMFDSNKHLTRPDKFVIDAYTNVQENYQCRVNYNIKSIVNPRMVKYITNPHSCFYKNGQRAVDENYQAIGDARFSFGIKNTYTRRNSISKIRINHYHTKSLEDYQRKLEIGFADQLSERPKDDENLNFKGKTIHDYEIQKYLPELTKRMAIKEAV